MMKELAALVVGWVRRHPRDAIEIGVVVASAAVRARSSLRPAPAPRRHRFRNAALVVAGVGVGAAVLTAARVWPATGRGASRSPM
jgi:hypothetical protein